LLIWPKIYLIILINDQYLFLEQLARQDACHLYTKPISSILIFKKMQKGEFSLFPIWLTQVGVTLCVKMNIITCLHTMYCIASIIQCLNIYYCFHSVCLESKPLSMIHIWSRMLYNVLFEWVLYFRTKCFWWDSWHVEMMKPVDFLSKV